MGDLLVRLYDLPPLGPTLAVTDREGVEIRRALALERRRVCRWVEDAFNERWASEVEMAFGAQPVRCLIAIGEGGALAGFACHDVTFRGFFGPIGVHPDFRGRGVGKALCLRGLHAMWEEGFAYAIVGDAGEPDFFIRIAGALEIPDSTPGAYRGRLR